jgi:hypothetical protein
MVVLVRADVKTRVRRWLVLSSSRRGKEIDQDGHERGVIRFSFTHVIYLERRRLLRALAYLVLPLMAINSTSKIKVELPGMTGGYPRAPYP